MQQTHDEIVTEITMSRDYKPWLAVEGDSDVKLLRTRSYPVSVKLIIGYGWKGVKAILDKHSTVTTTSRLYGLIDRDYRDHHNSQISHKNIILTDFRDVEIMLFNSSALARVISEYGSAGKIPKDENGAIDIKSIRDTIYSISIMLGKFRIYCESNNLNIRFKELDYKKFLCDRTLVLSVDNFLLHINGRNPSEPNLTLEQWKLSQELKWGVADDVNNHLNHPEFIANGHDVMGILCVALRKLWGSHGDKISSENIEGIFRVGYSDDELVKTRMWTNLEGCLK